MAKWSINLGEYATQKKKDITEVRRVFAFMLYSHIVMRTPVDTGRARGNWNVSASEIDARVTELKGAQYHSVNDMPNISGDEPIFIANNLYYIRKLEYGGYGLYKNGKLIQVANGPKTVNGYSKQAPAGMVGVTMAGVDAIFNAAVQAVSHE